MWYALSILVLMLFLPDASVSGALNGLRLCASAVVPTLFPFFVVSRVLITQLPKFSKQIFGIHPQVLSAFLISLLGGYPNGVATITAMYENGSIEKHEAENAILFCNNSGPGFFVSMVGSMVLGDTNAGLRLYFFHALSAILILLLFQKASYAYKIQRVPQKPTAFSQSFLTAVTNSCTVMLQVCGLVVFFSVLSSILATFATIQTLPADLRAILFGILELTSGVAGLQSSPNAFVLCAFLTGWGGFCVHMQAMNLCHALHLKPNGYYIAKLLHGILCAFFALTFLTKSSNLLVLSIIIVIICIVFSYIRQKWGRKKQRAVV